MNATTETFLARSREYLLGTGVQSQQNVPAGSNPRAQWPWPAPRRGSTRRAGTTKARRTGTG